MECQSKKYKQLKTENMTTGTLLIQLIASFAIGATLLFMSLKLIKSQFKIENINENKAVSILTAFLLISIAYLLAALNLSFITTLKILQQGSHSGIFLDVLKFSGLFLFITGIALLFIIYASFFIYSTIYGGLKAKDEISNNNVASAILVGMIILALSMIVKEGLIALIESFIPYPTTPVVY